MSVIIKNYKEPHFCEKEMLRYAGCKSSDDELLQLLRICIDEAREKLTYKICYRELPVTISGDTCDFEYMRVQSKNLAQNLQGCKKVIVFGATLGVEIDRMIAKYGRVSPSKALMMQAIGAERIEALCDAFCNDIAQERNVVVKPRFSPGYGDLPLEIQRELFGILDCAKRIGLFLNDSLLMSPSKSVTAFVGLAEPANIQKLTDSIESVNEKELTDSIVSANAKKLTNPIESVNATVTTSTSKKVNKCAACGKIDCEYRGVL